jgi:hypothetical protein
MTPWPCLYAHVSMTMSPRLHVSCLISPCPCLMSPCFHVSISLSPCLYVSMLPEFCKWKTKHTKNENFLLFPTNGKRKFVFLGQQTLNGNWQLLFQQTCPTIIVCVYIVSLTQWLSHHIRYCISLIKIYLEFSVLDFLHVLSSIGQGKRLLSDLILSLNSPDIWNFYNSAVTQLASTELTRSETRHGNWVKAKLNSTLTGGMIKISNISADTKNVEKCHICRFNFEFADVESHGALTFAPPPI